MNRLIQIAVLTATAAYAALFSPQVYAQDVPDGEVALVRLLESNVDLRGQVAEMRQSLGEVKEELRALRESIDKPGKRNRLVKTDSPDKSPNMDSHQRTAVCPCQSGAGERGCFCLQKGQQCGCPTKGSSVWNVDLDGRPISKTGERVQKGTQATSAPVRPSPTQPKQPARQPRQQSMVVQLPMVPFGNSGCPNCVRRYRYQRDD
jgi:hypothetical protein